MARPKEFTENTALERAIDTFWKKGYHSTSMQDLVDSMGINRASLYGTFGDKRQLYLKALETYRETTASELAGAIADEPSHREKIRLILRHMVADSLQDPDGKGCFFTNATLEMLPHDEAVDAIVCGNSRAMSAMLGNIIRAAQERGEISAEASPESLAHFVQCNINGLRVMAKTRPPARQLYAVVEQVMRVLS